MKAKPTPEPAVAVTPPMKQPFRRKLREVMTLLADPRAVLRAPLWPVRRHCEEQNHELQKVGKIELTELPWNRTQ